MATTVGRGDKSKSGSRAESPATSDLVQYIQKSNRTIKLLQEELHTTSQFAIKLSHKYEAKRAERDQIAEELSAAHKQNSKRVAQLQLLIDFITQRCKQQELPAAVAAVIADCDASAEPVSSKHTDQQQAAAEAGDAAAASASPEPPDTARRSPRVTLGGFPAITAAADAAVAAPVVQASADASNGSKPPISASHTFAVPKPRGRSPLSVSAPVQATQTTADTSAGSQRSRTAAAGPSSYCSTLQANNHGSTSSSSTSLAQTAGDHAQTAATATASGQQSPDNPAAVSRSSSRSLSRTASKCSSGVLLSPVGAAGRSGDSSPAVGWWGDTSRATSAAAPQSPPGTSAGASPTSKASDAAEAATAFSFGGSNNLKAAAESSHLSAALSQAVASSSQQQQQQTTRPVAGSPGSSPGQSSRRSKSNRSAPQAAVDSISPRAGSSLQQLQVEEVSNSSAASSPSRSSASANNSPPAAHIATSLQQGKSPGGNSPASPGKSGRSKTSGFSALEEAGAPASRQNSGSPQQQRQKHAGNSPRSPASSPGKASSSPTSQRSPPAATALLALPSDQPVAGSTTVQQLQQQVVQSPLSSPSRSSRSPSTRHQATAALALENMPVSPSLHQQQPADLSRNSSAGSPGRGSSQSRAPRIPAAQEALPAPGRAASSPRQQQQRHNKGSPGRQSSGAARGSRSNSRSPTGLQGSSNSPRNSSRRPQLVDEASTNSTTAAVSAGSPGAAATAAAGPRHSSFKAFHASTADSSAAVRPSAAAAAATRAMHDSSSGDEDDASDATSSSSSSSGDGRAGETGSDAEQALSPTAQVELESSSGISGAGSLSVSKDAGQRTTAALRPSSKHGTTVESAVDVGSLDSSNEDDSTSESEGNEQDHKPSAAPQPTALQTAADADSGGDDGSSSDTDSDSDGSDDASGSGSPADSSSAQMRLIKHLDTATDGVCGHVSAAVPPMQTSQQTLSSSSRQAGNRPSAVGALKHSPDDSSSNDSDDDGSNSSSDRPKLPAASDRPKLPAAAAGCTPVIAARSPSRQRGQPTIALPSTLDSDSDTDTDSSRSEAAADDAGRDDSPRDEEPGNGAATSSTSSMRSVMNHSAGPSTAAAQRRASTQSPNCTGPVGARRSRPAFQPVPSATTEDSDSSSLGSEPSSNSCSQLGEQLSAGPLSQQPSEHPSTGVLSQQPSIRHSGSFHSACGSPRSARSSHSSSMYSACSRSTRVSNSSLAAAASLLEPDNFGLLSEQNSSNISQHGYSADGSASTQGLQQQQSAPQQRHQVLSNTGWLAGKSGTTGTTSDNSLGEGAGYSEATGSTRISSSSSGGIDAGVLLATDSSHTGSARSSDGAPSGVSSSRFDTARSRSSTAGAAAAAVPAVPPAGRPAAAAQGDDCFVGSFVSEGGSIFGFVGGAFSSLQSAVASAGNVRAAAAAAVMGALPSSRAATEGGSNSSRAHQLQQGIGVARQQVTASGASEGGLGPQWQQQQQTWQQGAATNAFGSFSFGAGAGDRSSSGGGSHDDSASGGGSRRRTSGGGRVPTLTRYFAGRARGMSEDEARQQAAEADADRQAEEHHQQQQSGPSPSTLNHPLAASPQANQTSFISTSSLPVSTAAVDQQQHRHYPQQHLHGFDAHRPQRLQVEPVVESSSSGGRWSSLFGGLAAVGAALTPHRQPSNTSSPVELKAVAPRLTEGGAGPWGAAPASTQPFVFGGGPPNPSASSQSQSIVFGTAQPSPRQVQQLKTSQLQSAPGPVSPTRDKVGHSVKLDKDAGPAGNANQSHGAAAHDGPGVGSSSSGSEGDSGQESPGSDSAASDAGQANRRGNMFAMLGSEEAHSSSSEEHASDSDSDSGSWEEGTE